MENTSKVLILENGYSIRSYVCTNNEKYTVEIVMESPTCSNMYDELPDVTLFKKTYNDREEALAEVKNRMDHLCKATDGHAKVMILR